MNKPYRSLQDVYADNAFKHVSKPPRQKVIGEDVQVFYKPDGENQRVVGYIDDKLAMDLERKIANRSGGSFKIVDDLLCAAGWKENCEGAGSKEYVKKILSPVMTAIEETSDTYNVNLKRFLDTKNEQTQFENDMFNAYASGNTFDIIEAIKESINNCFSDPEDTVKEIYDISTTINNVGIGKGEIVTTMFSNGRQAVKGKGEKGDLYFPNIGSVELKTQKGRPGTGGIANQAPKRLEALLNQHSKGSNITTVKEIKAKHASLRNSFNALDNYLNTLIDSYNNSKGMTEGQIKEVVDSLTKVKNTSEVAYNKILDDNPKVEEIRSVYESIIDDIPNYITNGNVKRSLVSKIKPFYTKGIDYLNSLINKVPSKDMKKSTNNYVPAFFLHNWGFDKKTIIKAFLYLSSEDDDNINLKAYEKGLDEILTPEILRSLTRERNQLELEAIIASLQISQYQEHENFDCLLFVNDDMQALPLIFEGESVKEKFLNTYNFMRRSITTRTANNLRINVDLGIDKRSKGVQLTLTGADKQGIDI